MSANTKMSKRAESDEGSESALATVVSLAARPHAAEDLRSELERAERRVERLISENKKLVAEKESLNRVIDGIVSSRSWRLTAPMRNVRGTIRAIAQIVWPPFRFRVTRLHARAERDVCSTEGSFRIDGFHPSLAVEKADNSRAPAGWALLKIQVDSPQGHCLFYFHAPTSAMVNERQRVLIPAVSGQVAEVVLKIPDGYTNLRLEPFNIEGQFAIPRIELKHLGVVQFAFLLINKHFGKIVANPRATLAKARKAVALLRSGGLTALRAKLFAEQFSATYQRWVEQFDTLTTKDRSLIQSRISTLRHHPLISIVMPVYNTPEEWLVKAIESVKRQLYTNWELCIADDASSDPQVVATLQRFTAEDPRIKFVQRKTNGHISVASNDALALATGEFVALLDHDDELTEHALYLVVEEINANPEVEFIYSDEDKITSYGMRFNPHFKSDWNPELLCSQNYLCHLCVYRRATLVAVGGFRQGFEGAQDWDLALRVTDSIPESRIRHIPHVLYHWRVIEGSTAQSTAYKPYVLKAQQRSVEEHLQRRGIVGASVDILEHIAQLRVRYPLPDPAPLVSIIIPTRDTLTLLRRCVTSILDRTTYRNFEILIINNNSELEETAQYFASLKDHPQIRVIDDPRPFNYAALNNDALSHARGELIAFLNNDLEVITPEWLSEMVSYAVQPRVGAVGARLLFPNGLLQHGGVILGINGVAGHSCKGRLREDPGYFNRAILPQNFSAVTAACMVTRRDVLERSGGFDQENLSVAFNDVDLCLRIREAGFLIVYAAYAELFHFESASRGYETTPEKFMRFEREVETMKQRWGAVLRKDPYYNPNLTLLTEDYQFAFPKRAVRPWIQKNA